VRGRVEIRGLDGLRKRFAALGALKDLQPALRAEAEAVAEEAKARLTERNPNSRLARSIKIMALGTEDQPAYAVGTDDPGGFSWNLAAGGCERRPGLSQLCTLVYQELTMRSERLSRRL